MTDKKKEYGKTNLVTILLILVIALLAGIIIVAVLSHTLDNNEVEPETIESIEETTVNEIEFDSSITSLNELSEDEIVQKLNEAVDKSTFTISIRPEIYVDKSTMTGEAHIYNPDNNAYYMQCSLVLDDDNVIYESKVIPQGKEIKNVTINKLNSGTYECTAIFTAIDPKTGNNIGAQVQAIIKLVVQ